MDIHLHVGMVCALAMTILSLDSPRKYPFCVTNKSFEEYKANLKDGVHFGRFLDDTNIPDKHYQGNSLTAGSPRNNGLIESVKYFRIRNREPTLPSRLKVFRQWFHIHITTTQEVEGLLVQGIANTYGLPYGVFDLEFACTDCRDTDPSINPSNGLEGEALTLEGQAAVIPCARRSHLHMRHPNVYAFAGQGKAQHDFHMNYNFLDIDCRHSSLFQFIILAVVDFSKPIGEGNTDYFYSSVIDHAHVDSLDGMPYPFHGLWSLNLQCHVPDDQLPDEDKLHLRMKNTGDAALLYYNSEFDRCTMADSTDFIEDNSTKLSNRVCSNLPRLQCDVNKNISVPPRRTVPDPVNLGDELCIQCDDNVPSVEKQIIIKKSFHYEYITRKVHGYLMIFGCLVILIISIHVARYFKEGKTGCLLVGWWLWSHLALSYLSKGVIWIGLALVLLLPARDPEHKIKDQICCISDPRDGQIKIHKFIGLGAMLLFHFDFFVGSWRPLRPIGRMVMISLHSICGYLTVILSALAVLFSTACQELVILTMMMVASLLIHLILGLVIQVLVDAFNPLIPKRKLFPVIEAIQIPQSMPLMLPRVAVLIVLTGHVVILFILMCVFGDYEGLGKMPCQNCRWKWDDVVTSLKSNVTSSLMMYKHYSCNITDNYWKSIF